MGAVYLGTHATLGSRVAVKVLSADIGTSEISRARFRREASLAANLSHPNIVPVFEYDVTGGIAYLVMPFIEGQSLAAILAAGGALPFDKVQELVQQIGNALEFAHARGIVHRDVKPQNILFEEATCRWLLTDFGVAHVVEVSPEQEITGTGASIGTPRYMAPEQRGHADTADARSDLYSFAAVVHEALTGKAFDPAGGIETLTRELARHYPELPDATRRALIKPLATDRASRPPSVSAWMALIRSAPGRRMGNLTAIIAVSVALVAVWWILGRPGAPRTRIDTRNQTVAVLPFWITGDSSGGNLDSVLPQAFVWQLSNLPGQRVVNLTGRTQSGAIDSLVAIARSAGAAVALAGQAAVHGRNVSISVQLHDVQSGILAGADTAGPLDSLHSLVSGLVISTFGTRMAEEQTGIFNPSLPHGMPAVTAYFRGERAFRSGDYEVALGSFNRTIELDSTFAPAYFKRMLALIIARPTRAGTDLGSAVQAAREYSEQLDPVSRKLLDGYVKLIDTGDPELAEQVFQEITTTSSSAVDAWFALGLLRFHFGPLLGRPLKDAQIAFEEAARLDRKFAAPLLYLITLALAEGNDREARDYMQRYLALDSTSSRARLVAAGDTLIFRPALAYRVLASLRDRPTDFLEDLAFVASEFGRTATEREFGLRALDALWDRAASPGERARAFRMRMAALLGSGRYTSARTFLKTAQKKGVPSSETDAWTVLAWVTPLYPLTDRARVVAAARRLSRSTDVTARWLSARFTGDRRPFDELADTVLTSSSRRLRESLELDLQAVEALSRGDTAVALEIWHKAQRRFTIETVPFGLVASLWPMRLQRIVAAAAGHMTDTVLETSRSFVHIASFVDQAALPLILPLRAASALQAGDTITALNSYQALLNLLSDPQAEARFIRLDAEQRYQELLGSAR